MENQVAEAKYVVKSWNPWLNRKKETHLEYTVWFTSANGRSRWSSGIIDWGFFIEGTTLCDYVLALMPEFVQSRWFQLEVCIPNRDEFGHIQSGFVKDTGLLLVTRELEEAA